MATPASEPAWPPPPSSLLAAPHAVQDKAKRVHKMFAAIAPFYDLNNRLHSLWMDQHWRSVAVQMAEVQPTDTIVDVACGTGDLTLKFARKNSRVMGIDFTDEMLAIARKKVPNASFVQGDALALPLSDASADIVSIAFGIRNVADWGKAINEFTRILRPGGRLIILEFSLPTNPMIRWLYDFYFRKMMPVTATFISRDRSGAYKYLPESVHTFISCQAMQERMRQAGFTGVTSRPLTCGICVCHKGVKQ